MAESKVPTLDADGKVFDKHLPARLGESELSTTIDAAVSAEEVRADAAYSTPATLIQGMASTRLTVVNESKLTRWTTALQDAETAPAIVTVIGDSISWGVGSDGSSGTAGPTAFGTYRQSAWPVILRKLFARAHGTAVAENWIGTAPGWGYATISAGASPSSSIAPFGQLFGTHSGAILAGNAQTVTIPKALSGRFTCIDIQYWGTDSGVTSPSMPSVTIDGVAESAGSAGPLAGNLNILRITGLADTTHDIVLSAPTTNTTCYVPAVVTHHGNGVIVNRIAIPGATTYDAVGGTLTGQGKQRNIDSATLKGYSSLVAIMLGTNDNGSQLPIADYKANLQLLIDSAVGGGACVLLVGAPPSWVGETVTITESQYRAAMSELSTANDHVAYVDTRPLFGDRTLSPIELFSSAGTVHPSAKGHRLIGGTMFDAVPMASI